jgi:hypothetical protein
MRRTERVVSGLHYGICRPQCTCIATLAKCLVDRCDETPDAHVEYGGECPSLDNEAIVPNRVHHKPFHSGHKRPPRRT